MSSTMPSVVKNQSQLRVPPTPCTILPSAKGNCKPECRMALLLPAAGLPMIMYHGNSYRAAAPDLRPSLDVLMVSMAASMPVRTASSSPCWVLLAVEDEAACAAAISASLRMAWPSAWASRRARRRRHSHRPSQVAKASSSKTRAQISATSSTSAPRYRNTASATKPRMVSWRLSVRKCQIRRSMISPG
ncbi:hypothetical protein D3C72_1805860 [compost metagenome]